MAMPKPVSSGDPQLAAIQDALLARTLAREHALRTLRDQDDSSRNREERYLAAAAVVIAAERKLAQLIRSSA